VTAVVISVLAIALLAFGWPRLLAGTALVMLAFVALDILEVSHQLDDSRQALAALAASIAFLQCSPRGRDPDNATRR